MQKKRPISNLITASILCLLGFVVFSISLPDYRLAYFVPLLIVSFYYFSKTPCLWISLGIGLCFDLISSQYHFGIYGLTFTVTSWFLYDKKPIFIEESIFSLSLMTFLYASLSRVLLLLTLNFFDEGFEFSWNWFSQDIIMLSFYDALYALFWFMIPMRYIQNRLQKRFQPGYRKKRPK
jgi:rod shape-determining protein MreD